jgi:uncharacterized protein (TIGR00369 family)
MRIFIWTFEKNLGRRSVTVKENAMINPDKVLLLSHKPGDVLPFEGEAQKFAKALGGHVTAVDITAGMVELRFAPGEDFLQGMGVIQGGAVSAMLDFAMGFAGMAMMEEGAFITTATLNIAFLRPALAGTYFAKGFIERRGKTLLFSRGELHNESGTLVATGTSSLVVVRPD